MSNGAEAPKKKGLGTLAWIGIGCGVLVVIVAVVLVVGSLFMVKKAKQVAGDLDFDENPGLAAARLVVRLNPELEEVEVDEEAGTITVRSTKTGELVTVDFEDIQEGKISWSTDDGEVTIDASGDEGDGTLSVTTDDKTWKLETGVETTGEIPDWVPIYPGTEVEGSHVVSGDDGLTGGFRLQTDDSVDAVVESYRSVLEERGFTVQVNSFSGDEQGALVHGIDDATGRGVTVMSRGEAGTTTIAVSFREGS
jgi:hypothetical protein